MKTKQIIKRMKKLVRKLRIRRKRATIKEIVLNKKIMQDLRYNSIYTSKKD